MDDNECNSAVAVIEDVMAVVDVESSMNKKKFCKICLCGKIFHSRSYYFLHKKNCGIVKACEPTSQSGNFRCLEKGCIFRGKYTNILMNHLKTDHNIQYNEEYKIFQTYAEFKDWLKFFEKETKSSFVFSNKRKTEVGITEYFRCSRSGKYCMVTIRKRAWRSYGTKKIGFNCPANIRLFIEDNPQQVTATINAFHYGHEDNDSLNNHATTVKKHSVKFKNEKTAKKIAEILKQHKNALELPASLLRQISAGVWLMKSEKSSEPDDLFYLIEQLPQCKRSCRIKCQQCNICLHSYKCSCPDALTGTTICKHVHFIVQKEEETAAISGLCAISQKNDNSEDNSTEIRFTYVQDSENSNSNNENCPENTVNLGDNNNGEKTVNLGNNKGEKTINLGDNNNSSVNLDDEIDIIKMELLKKTKLIYKQIKRCADKNVLLQIRPPANNIYDVLGLSEKLNKK